MLVHNFIRTVGLSHKMPDLARIVRLCFGRCDIYSSVVFNKGSTACGLQIGAVKLDAGVEITAKITGHETRYILLADFYNLECLRFMEGASIHKTVATAAKPVLRELNISPGGNVGIISIRYIKNLCMIDVTFTILRRGDIVEGISGVILCRTYLPELL